MSFAEADQQPPVFKAVIAPHRSLTPRGVLLVIALLMLFIALISIRFWLLGAWPVVLFSVVEVPLAVLLLLINIRMGRASEIIMLTARDVTVTRTDPKGRRSTFAMSAAWLSISHDTSKNGSHVILRARREAHEIGAFLHDAEKESLFRALDEALHGVRNPRFDNPQLRDPSKPDQGSDGPIDLIRSNTRLRMDGSVIR